MGAGDLDAPTQKLLRSLYYNEFNAYVKHRLVQHAHVRLGAPELGSASIEGLGEAFCLTNPRLPDSPIVLCSPAFERITGYSRDQIIGRNCRFLQGSATAPDSVRTIREAVVHGEAITQLLLNYRLDGTPFWCLLSILPLRDDKNNLVYFIGGQTNVSGMITSSNSTSLSFLLTDVSTGSAPAGPESPPTLGTDFTQEVRNQARRRSEVDAEEGFYGDNPYAGPDLIAMPTPPPTDAISSAEEDDTPHHPSPTRKGSTGLISFAVKRHKTQTIAPLLSRAMDKAAPLTDYVKEFALTYERVMLIRRQENKVLFATRQFLSSCGLPAKTDADVNASALLYTNLIDHIVRRTTHGTKAARLEVEAAITEGRRLSVACGIKLKEGPFPTFRRAFESTVFGLLHLTPLVDLGSEPVAFVAVFAPDEPHER
ncbi:hypothetical protein P7C70_g1726, partial [Phenoliferia sp. Uapishka_3]